MLQKFTGKKISVRLLALAMSATWQVQAQVVATPKEAMMPSFRQPQLLEGGGDMALVRAIQMRVVYPRRALRDNAQGMSQVSFAVAPTGQVCQIKMLYGLRPDLDTAVVRAVRQLPRLQPATQHGRPVACLMRAPISFFIDNATRPPRHPLPTTDSTQVYPTVAWMPRYKGELGYSQLKTDLLAEYLRLGQANGCFIPKLGTHLAVTVGPHGTIYDVRLVKRDEEEQAALRAQFGAEVAQAEPGLDVEFPVSCLPQLAEAARRLPHLTPAYVNGKPVATRLLLPLLSNQQ